MSVFLCKDHTTYVYLILHLALTCCYNLVQACWDFRALGEVGSRVAFSYRGKMAEVQLILYQYPYSPFYETHFLFCVILCTTFSLCPFVE